MHAEERAAYAHSPELPAGYYLVGDPDALRLYRPDGSAVAAFSTWGISTGVIREAAGEDSRRELTTNGWGATALASKAKPRAARLSLRANFFGHFGLLCEGETLPLGRNFRALTILKYLLVHRDRPVSRDHLMSWLWPESNPRKARWSLNSTVYTLRKLLDGCLPPAASAGYILLEEGHYHFSPDIRMSTDVDEFDLRYERGRRFEKAGLIPDAIAEYERAAGLYRDDFLVEDLYEDWTMIERERLTSAYVDIADRLASHYAQTGQVRESIRTCYRVLDKDCCHEDTYRRLMRCYARLGLRDRALHQYRLCERMLRHRYATAPSPVTEALYKSLLRGGCAPSWREEPEI